ncbi:MAG: hypothetical protein ACREA0_00305 [bacterium]
MARASDDPIPEWVTGAEARFLTGEAPEILRQKVTSGRVALFRPFGPGHRVVFLRTADLIGDTAR